MRRGTAAFASMVLAIAVVGCGEDGAAPAAPASTPSASGVPESSTPVSMPTVSTPSTDPAGILANCPKPGAKPFTATAAGASIEGVTLGRGKRGVVLSYEWGSDACAWADIAAELASKGYLVALWEYGELTGLERIRELQAVVDHLRKGGATKVALAGGSLGGCVSMIGASMVRPAVAGVAVLSCALWYDVQHRMPTTPLAAKVRVPALYLTGAADSRLPAAEVRKDFTAVPAKDKNLVVVAGSAAHGVGLLAAAPAKTAFLAFLDRVTR